MVGAALALILGIAGILASGFGLFSGGDGFLLVVGLGLFVASYFLWRMSRRSAQRS